MGRARKFNHFERAGAMNEWGKFHKTEAFFYECGDEYEELPTENSCIRWQRKTA